MARVVKILHRTVQHSHNCIDAAVVVDVAECNAAMGRGLLEIRACIRAGIPKLSIAEIAKDGIWFRIRAIGSQSDIVEDVSTRDEEILPAVVVEIEDPVGPSRHVSRNAK